MAEESSTTKRIAVRGVSAVVVDIEGTTTPITFVRDVLFPYVLDRLNAHLRSAYDTAELREDIAQLRQLAQADIAQASTLAECELFSAQCIPIPAHDAADGNKEDVCKAVAHNVRVYMKHDRKVTALKYASLCRGSLGCAPLLCSLSLSLSLEFFSRSLSRPFGLNTTIHTTSSTVSPSILHSPTRTHISLR
jgi:hypothetical protein